MKKALFRLLASINKVIMPRYSKKDLGKLSRLDKLLVVYRYWVTKNSL